MKKVLKFVKGKKEEKRECGGLSPSGSGEVLSSGQTPEEEGFSGVENGYGYSVDLCGKDKTLTKLHKAAWQGNLEKLKSGLKKVEVDAVDRHNRTALHLAVAQGHPNIVWFLLGNNAKTSICDDEGHSPLLKAIECGHKECMTLLLDRGADVNAADYSGNTGLHIAVSRGSLDIVSALLKKIANTELSNNAGDYPLHIATKLENKELVDLLLGAGAHPDVLDRENRTPLMLAAKTGNSVLAQLFIERGVQLAVVDSNGWTAQDYALLGGHEGIASSLCARSHPKPDTELTSSDYPLRDTSASSGKDHDHVANENIALQEQLRQEGEGDKREDSSESPDAEVIPPYCQPPRSWEMIQAGMIDLQKDGSEPKRRAITALGTLHSRRDSFADPPPPSPKSTLSLNRRRRRKEQNAFAKHRFSLNEERSLRQWVEPGGVEVGGGGSESGTLGRRGTMREVEELWVSNAGVVVDVGGGETEGEEGFPPPPSGLELGVDMAKSIRSVRGLSVEQPLSRSDERKVWRKAYGSQSLDWLEEREAGGEEMFRCQKPRDKLTEVSKRINEQLECYDQALRELAESSRKQEREEKAHKFYSLPCKGAGGEWRGRRWGGEREVDTRRKRQMLLAMRDVKHEVDVGKAWGTSVEEVVLTPMGGEEEGLASDDKWSPKGVSSSSGGNSPAEENPFFGIGRQETVVERESEGSGTGEESTLWLQDEEHRKEDSEEDVEEIGAEDGWKHKRAPSFSPLGVIQREMEEASRESGCSGRRASPTDKGVSGENGNPTRSEQLLADRSPDVSLSSGPIEPLGAEKDSGSEPESSHNDVSPPHNYAMKSHHEWLRCHLRAATSEKNKLEELTAQLTEKAERLQYELADAKEAAKSRDEVIQLLQGQLARMEAAYTKSLEESVQNRLQLTCHEQEILHLKELCYRYQEEKEAAGNGAGAGEMELELQSRIKALEEERERMREEMSHLEEEKSVLEGRLKGERQGGAEMMEQCQLWKERCMRLEEMVEGYESEVAKTNGELVVEEKETKQQRVELERKLLEAREESAELRGRLEGLEGLMERERRRARGVEEEKEELRTELRRQKKVVEGEVRRVEKEMEEKMVRKLKEKEEEVSGLVAQFKREREKLMEGRREKERAMGGSVGGWRRWEEDGEGGWKSLCGRGGRRMKGAERRSGGGFEEAEEGGPGGGGSLGEMMGPREELVRKSHRQQDLELIELKKQILSLESKMSDEKNFRRALENEMLKMRVNLNEKENLEKEVDSLKRKISRHCLGKSGVELLEYERNLQAKQERYLDRENVVVQQLHCDYKGKCEMLVKERERAKHLVKESQKGHKTSTPPSPPPRQTPIPDRSYHPPHPQRLLPPRQVTLHPDIKNNLDYQLDRSIRKYIQDSASLLSVPDIQT